MRNFLVQFECDGLSYGTVKSLVYANSFQEACDIIIKESADGNGFDNIRNFKDLSADEQKIKEMLDEENFNYE